MMISLITAVSVVMIMPPLYGSHGIITMVAPSGAGFSCPRHHRGPDTRLEPINIGQPECCKDACSKYFPLPFVLNPDQSGRTEFSFKLARAVEGTSPPLGAGLGLGLHQPPGGWGSDPGIET